MPNETQKKINEAEKGEKGKKSSYKRTTFEKNADFELIMEMCLTINDYACINDYLGQRRKLFKPTFNHSEISLKVQKLF